MDQGERGGGEEPGGADREEIVFGISCVREESIFDFKKIKNEHPALSEALSVERHTCDYFKKRGSLEIRDQSSAMTPSH